MQPLRLTNSVEWAFLNDVALTRDSRISGDHIVARHWLTGNNGTSDSSKTLSFTSTIYYFGIHHQYYDSLVFTAVSMMVDDVG